MDIDVCLDIYVCMYLQLILHINFPHIWIESQHSNREGPYIHKVNFDDRGFHFYLPLVLAKIILLCLWYRYHIYSPIHSKANREKVPHDLRAKKLSVHISNKKKKNEILSRKNKIIPVLPKPILTMSEVDKRAGNWDPNPVLTLEKDRPFSKN